MNFPTTFSDSGLSRGKSDRIDRLKLRSSWRIALGMLGLALATNCNVASADTVDVKKPETLSVRQIERSLADVYSKVAPATVRLSPSDGPSRNFTSAIIVSADGYILQNSQFPAGKELRVEFSDGKTGAAKALGWSAEWNVGLSKINENGPWPFVPFGAPEGVVTGECVVSLQYPHPDSPQPVHNPLLLVDWVNRSAPGHWFMLASAQVATAGHWNDCRFVCDLKGQLAGIVSVRSHGKGVTVTHSRMIKALWSDLAAGKNLDQVRLELVDTAQEAVQVVAQPANITEEIKKEVIAASVQIRSAANVRERKKGWSGTIVSPTGLVATCAHTYEMPGANVLVSLPDGRDLPGQVVGVSLPCDIGLIQIKDVTEPLPYAEMGDSRRMRSGQACLFLGYGPVPMALRQPLLRTSSIAEPPHGEISHLLHSDPKTKFVGGDSGGGLFNSDGQLVAFHTGIGTATGSRPRPHQNPRVELFRKHWDELHSPFQQSTDSPLATVQDVLHDNYRRGRESIVELLDGDNRIALGTCVDGNGVLLTKASLLSDRFDCRLSDGRVLGGKVLRTVREHDVAVVKVDAVDLKAIEWSTLDDLPVGSVVAIAAADASPTLGFVSNAPFAFPAEKGHLRAEFSETDNGLEVTKVEDLRSSYPFLTIRPSTLRQGDILLSLGEHPTPDREASSKLLDINSNNLVGVSGDIIQLLVNRDGQQVQLREVLAPPFSSPRFAGQTPRSSGFPRVLSVNANATSEMCGGPVMERDGRASGIALGWRNNGWLFVLPAALAKTIAAEDPQQP